MKVLPDDALKDPVCGMRVSPQSPHRYQGDGGEFWFCCARCRDRFAENPKAFLHSVEPRSAAEPRTAPSAGNTYTCPMHPDVRQSRPGSCPKCGMALEPVTPIPSRAAEW